MNENLLSIINFIFAVISFFLGVILGYTIKKYIYSKIKNEILIRLFITFLILTIIYLILYYL